MLRIQPDPPMSELCQGPAFCPTCGRGTIDAPGGKKCLYCDLKGKDPNVPLWRRILFRTQEIGCLVFVAGLLLAIPLGLVRCGVDVYWGIKGGYSGCLERYEKTLPALFRSIGMPGNGVYIGGAGAHSCFYTCILWSPVGRRAWDGRRVKLTSLDLEAEFALVDERWVPRRARICRIAESGNIPDIYATINYSPDGTYVITENTLGELSKWR